MAQQRIQIPGIGSANRVGLGLLQYTAITPQVVGEPAYQAIKAAIDSGVTVLNSATFYATPDKPLAGIHLIHDFFAAYPEYADKVIITVKGGMSRTMERSGKLDYLREDVGMINKILDGKKKLDVYGPARIPDDVSVEELMQNLVTLKNEGHFSAIGLSEVSGPTIRKANAVHQVATVENELSLFTLDKEHLDALKACEDCNIALLAYSPLGKGFLSGKYSDFNDLPENDRRRMFPRYVGENAKKNAALANQLKKIAEKKGVAPAQLAIAYVLQMSPATVPIPGSTNIERIKSNNGSLGVTFTKEELQEIEQILKENPTAGDRYYAQGMTQLMK